MKHVLTAASKIKAPYCSTLTMYRTYLLIASLAITFCSFTNHSSENDELWLTNFELARKLAVEDGKPILMVFSGSDWCKPCMILHETILNTEEFSAYAKDHVVLLKVDFPSFRKNRLSKEHQKHNDALAEKYNEQGYFPNVLLVDAEGNIIAQISYSKGMKVQSFINQLNTAQNIDE